MTRKQRSKEEKKIILQIDDTIRIVKWDKFNLAIEQFQEVKDNRNNNSHFEWLWQGFYSTMKSALRGVLHHKLCGNETTQTIQGLIVKIDTLEQRFKDLKVLD